MSNFLLNDFNNKTPEQQQNLGNVSDKLQKSGCHLATIKDMFITTTDTWSKVDVNFTTPNGTVNISEFNSVPRDETPEAEKKAKAANDRLQNSIARMLKAAGLKDMAAVSAGAVNGTDDKDRATITFPKAAGKKLHITTYTEIQADKDGAKAYVNQTIDTFKYLDKSGLNGMKIDSVATFDADAKERIEIYFKDDNNPACIAKLAQVTEQRAGTATTTTAPASNPGTGMPTANTETPAPAQEDDI